jgi:hypothetical protein
MPIALDGVDAPHGRSELELTALGYRIGGLLTRVGPLPAAGAHHLGRVGHALEYVLRRVGLAPLLTRDSSFSTKWWEEWSG